LFVLLYDNAFYTLGAIDDGTFAVLYESENPIQGPLETAGGKTFIALDGMLMELRQDQAQPTGEGRNVTCLERFQSFTYACVEHEIYMLSDAGLGERVFTLDGLHAPRQERVPDAARSSCAIQWALFRSDLARVGIAAADAEPDDPADAGTPDPKAPEGGQPEMEHGSESSTDEGGCRSAGAGGGSRGAWMIALLTALALRRRLRNEVLHRGGRAHHPRE
jgi:hypothetical protein